MEETETAVDRPETESSAAQQLNIAAETLKASLAPISEAIKHCPAELLQDLADANLNAHHALGRLNSARAMLARLEPPQRA